MNSLVSLSKLEKAILRERYRERGGIGVREVE